jgi:hypothetical protein
MPISVPPEQEELVQDEISHAEDGITVASDRKSHTSYDIVFSANPEIDTLLAGSGAYTRPFFNSDVLVLLHGPRKAFYHMLLDLGFQPSHLAVTQ